MPVVSAGFKSHWTAKDIRKRMIDFDLRINEFAQLVGLSTKQMSAVLNNHRTITRIVELRIDEVFEKLERECDQKSETMKGA